MRQNIPNPARMIALNVCQGKVCPGDLLQQLEAQFLV